VKGGSYSSMTLLLRSSHLATVLLASGLQLGMCRVGHGSLDVLIHYNVKKLKGCLAICGKSITKLQSVTCCMGSHSVTCHLTQVNLPRLNPS